MKMKDWIHKLDAFLKFNKYEVLTDAGRVSHEVAVKLAGGEYEKFRVMQEHEYAGDFEREVKRITSKQRRGKDIPAAHPLYDVQRTPKPVVYPDVSIARLTTL